MALILVILVFMVRYYEKIGDWILSLFSPKNKEEKKNVGR
jgi:predicted PurR-regulated permease PerM